MVRALCVLAAAAVFLGSCHGDKGNHGDEGDRPMASLATMTPALIQQASVARQAHALKSAFVIVMENHDWDEVVGNPAAPYLNGTLLRIGAHAERYTGPYNVHPSEPNYIWLEAGDTLDISDDDDPQLNYRTTKTHLSTQLEIAGVSWRAWQEHIDPGLCPIASSGLYGAKHDPFVFFDDVTEGRNPHSAHCIEHIRDYSELSGGAAPAHYNFITPDLCNDMHNPTGCALPDSIANGDAWLAHEIPTLMETAAYRDGGVIFITWDESEGGADTPIGLIALSPLAKPGYSNVVPYTHSSLLRTVQDIFALQPYMRDAANANALSDLFVAYP